MVMAGGDYIDEIEPFRRNDPLGHADVRFVRLRVFGRERIGQVRVEQKVMVLPLNEKAALAEPPEVEMLDVRASVRHVGQKGFVL